MYTGKDVTMIATNGEEYQVRFKDGVEYDIPYWAILSNEGLATISPTEDNMRELLAKYVNNGIAIRRPVIPY